MSTHTEFQYSINMVTIDDENVIEHLGAVVDLQVAFATYRAACERWPGAAITLRQGARIIGNRLGCGETTSGGLLPRHGATCVPFVAAVNAIGRWTHTEALPVPASK